MRKIFLLIMLPVFLLSKNELFAQCSANISANPNTTQLNCTNKSIVLTASASGAGTKTYKWSTGATTASITVKDSGIYTVAVKNVAGCTDSSAIRITKDISFPLVSALAFPATICRGSTATLVAVGAAKYLWQPGAKTGAVITVTADSTTNYTVIGTAANGCADTSVLPLVVNPLPKASVSGLKTVCQNSVPPVITFKGTGGTKPYTFTYTVNDGPIQTITTIKTDTTVTVSAPTGTAGKFTYKLLSVTDSIGCTQQQTGTAVITVLSGATLTSKKAVSICDSTLFIYVAQSSVAGTVFTWTRAAVNGIKGGGSSGSGAGISERLVNNTTEPVLVKYIFTLSVGSGCFTSDSVMVIVNPTPVIDRLNNLQFCNGEFARFGVAFTSSSPAASFTWINDNPDIDLPASGSGNILPFIAQNTTAFPIIATIKVFIKASADSCVGNSRTFTITVLPAPVLTSVKNRSVCDSALFTYVAKSSAAATVFNWNREVVTGIKNPAASGSDSIINETLKNTTSQPIVVKYIFTLFKGIGCITVDSVMVTVNPTPVIDIVNDSSFCNGTFVNNGIPLTSVTRNASISWTNSNPGIGLPATGVGNIPAFIATNNSNQVITAVITVSVKIGADNCDGINSRFSITVLPSPGLSGTKRQGVCDNTPFRYNAQSTVAGTSFSWNRASVPGISNPATNQSSGTINETLHNTTPQPVIVKYIFTLSSGSGCLNYDSVLLTVNPTPVTDKVKDTVYCNGTPVSNGIPFTSSTPGSLFSWQNSDTAIGLGASGNGSIPRFFATNTTGRAIKATITVLIKAGADNCAGDPFTFTITVLPSPILTSIKDGNSCSGGLFSYTALSQAENTSFSWTRDFVPGINNPPSAGVTPNINETLDNITAGPIDVHYNFTLSTGTGCVSQSSVKVTVFPKPFLTSSRTTSLCDNTPFNYTLVSSTAGTTFGWTRNAVTGIINPDSSGSTRTINEILDNTGTQPVTVKYSLNLSTGNVCFTTDSIEVIVNPTSVTNQVSNLTFCNGSYVAAGVPFTTSSPAASFTWKNDNVNIGLPDSGSGNIPPFVALNKSDSSITANITVFIKASADSCAGIGTTFSITVLPAPLLTSITTTSICDSTFFNYTALSSAGNTIFTWTRGTVNGINTPASAGSGPVVHEILDNNTSQPVPIQYMFTLSTGGGCDTKQPVVVTVNPTPVIDRISDKTFCNGDFVNGTIAFTSTSPEPVFTWANSDSKNTIGIPAAGTGNIPAFIATNDSSITITDTITVSIKASSDNCAGKDTMFRITVLPSPVLTSSKTEIICDSSLFSYTASSSVGSTIFSWTRDSVTGISNSAAGAPGGTINEFLYNISAQPVIVKYILKSTGGGCDKYDTVKVTVNPTATIDPIVNYALCSGSLASPISFKSASTGAVFTWTSDQQIGFGNRGSGDTIPAFIPNNPGNSIITAKLSVSASVGNCPGKTANFEIKVYPTPIIVSSKDTSVCDGAIFSYTARSSAAATVFSWARDSVTGVTNSRSTGSGPNINERLDNNTGVPVVVKYIFKVYVSDPACTHSENVNVTVNPTPVIDTIQNRTYCNGSVVSGISFRSNTPDTSFTWVSDIAIGFGSSGSEKIPSFVATNTGSDPVVAHIKVSITASADKCRGKDTTFTITVNPGAPKAAFTSLFKYPNTVPLQLCTGAGSINFNVNSPVDGIDYRWSSTSDSLSLFIKDHNRANTVISFTKAGIDTINAISRNNAGGCTDSVSQIVTVGNSPDQIVERKIFTTQPGNLLIYPDNSLTSYQWGYDSVSRLLPNTFYGASVPLQGQVYQFFTPDARFITSNNLLDTTNYLYWVLLQKNSCSTRVYYNGPYANRRGQVIPSGNNVALLVRPNPNNGIFEIDLSGNIYGRMEATIYNSTGQVVFAKKFAKTAARIAEPFITNNLPGGLYYLVLQSSDLKKVVSRFVIQH